MISRVALMVCTHCPGPTPPLKRVAGPQEWRDLGGSAGTWAPSKPPDTGHGKAPVCSSRRLRAEVPGGSLLEVLPSPPLPTLLGTKSPENRPRDHASCHFQKEPQRASQAWRRTSLPVTMGNGWVPRTPADTCRGVTLILGAQGISGGKGLSHAEFSIWNQQNSPSSNP